MINVVGDGVVIAAAISLTVARRWFAATMARRMREMMPGWTEPVSFRRTVELVTVLGAAVIVAATALDLAR